MQAVISTASAPFDSTDADVILRTCNHVDFHVHKVILRMASGFFQDMFSMPQPANPNETDLHSDKGVPIIPISEDAKTLDYLLRLCYPTPHPASEDMELIGSALTAARKYEMDLAVSRMKNSLLVFTSNQALRERTIRVYAKAVQLGLEDVARAAAVASTSWSTVGYIPELDNISAGALYRFLQFRRMGQKAPVTFTFCRPTPGGEASEGIDGQEGHGSGAVKGKRAMTNSISPMFNRASADVVVRSSDNVDFRLSRSILSLASPVFEDLLSHLPNEDGGSANGAPPLISAKENSHDLNQLFQLCYPMENPRISDIDSALALHDIAVKYQIPFAMTFARKAFAENIGTHPLRAYFIAMRKKWTTEAREAARCTIFVKPHLQWVPEMEEVPAAVYRQLLDYGARCHSIVHEASKMDTGILSRSSLEKAPHWSDVNLEKAERSGWAIDNLLVDVHGAVASAPPHKGVEEILAVAFGRGEKYTRDKLLQQGQKITRLLNDAYEKIVP